MRQLVGLSGIVKVYAKLIENCYPYSVCRPSLTLLGLLEKGSLTVKLMLARFSL